jgi:hypothetical protein
LGRPDFLVVVVFILVVNVFIIQGK